MIYFEIHISSLLLVLFVCIFLHLLGFYGKLLFSAIPLKIIWMCKVILTKCFAHNGNCYIFMFACMKKC